MKQNTKNETKAATNGRELTEDEMEKGRELTEDEMEMVAGGWWLTNSPHIVWRGGW